MKTLPLFLVILLFFSCSQNDNSIESLSQDINGEDIFSGIFFFNKSFVEDIPTLNDSMVYSLIEKNPTIKENLQEINRLVINEIYKIRPSFFEEFQVGISSGNQQIVQKTLTDASTQLFNSVEKIFGDQKFTDAELTYLITEGKLDEILDNNGEVNEILLEELFAAEEFHLLSLNSDSAGKCLFAGVVIIAVAYVFAAAVAGLVLAINIGAVVNVAGGVNVYLAANVQRYGSINFGIEKGAGSNGLQNDLLINELTNKFSK